jgi:DNA-binding transcriptional LysR family regulator
MNDLVDMKALRAIHVLTTCGSVTKTAELLDVSPGTISYLLNKVRKQTGSALFFRTRNGMIPDNIAKELSQRYQSITQELFDDKNIVSLTNRDITISTYSLLELLISMVLSDKKAFPASIKFTAPELNDENRLVRLRNKEVDIDIGTRLPLDKSIIQVDFLSCDVSIVVSKYHPTIANSFSMDDWYNNHHILWSRGMSLTCTDFQHANRFNDIINKRKVSVISSSSLNMTMLCAYSNHIMLMPTMVVKYLEERLPIRAFEAPPELKMRFDCYLHYHYTLANDSAMLNILSEIQRLVK